MNIAEDRSNSIPDVAIDRLVDGDLSEADRRDLLLRLENDLDGWRRCALAFLEDQAWRQALAGSALSSSRREPAIAVPPTSRRGRSWLRLAPIAASLLVATFAAGFAAGEVLRRPGRLIMAQAEIPIEPKPDPAGPADPIHEVGWIDVTDRSTGESPPRRVPILAGQGVNERWLRDRPPSVPEYQKAKWERQGYQVEERRRLVSVVLTDGRRVSIPVDEVELEYVGQQPF